MSHTLNLCLARQQVYAPRSARVSRNIVEGTRKLMELSNETHLLEELLLIREVQKQVSLDSVAIVYTIFGMVAFV